MYPFKQKGWTILQIHCFCYSQMTRGAQPVKETYIPIVREKGTSHRLLLHIAILEHKSYLQGNTQVEVQGDNERREYRPSLGEAIKMTR